MPRYRRKSRISRKRRSYGKKRSTRSRGSRRRRSGRSRQRRRSKGKYKISTPVAIALGVLGGGIAGVAVDKLISRRRNPYEQRRPRLQSRLRATARPPRRLTRSEAAAMAATLKEKQGIKQQGWSPFAGPPGL